MLIFRHNYRVAHKKWNIRACRGWGYLVNHGFRNDLRGSLQWRTVLLDTCMSLVLSIFCVAV